MSRISGAFCRSSFAGKALPPSKHHVALSTPTNGFDLAAGLRRNAKTQHLPIIMLTARGFAKDVLRGREVGAAGYITKPFTAEEVIRRVKAFLG
jgi:DNA-binding response OmpR family regulator